MYYSHSSIKTDILFSYFCIFSWMCWTCSLIIDELVLDLVPTSFLIKFAINLSYLFMFRTISGTTYPSTGFMADQQITRVDQC